jgi:hypothetical protein
MTRRLFYLNALLLLAAVALGLRLRALWDDARQREEMVRLNELIRPVYRAKPPAPQVQAVNSASYSDVAMKMLFSRDRNPTVIIDIPPPKPEPPQPPFPKSNGVMLLGEPRILLTAKSGEGQKIYKIGDKVGEFEILAFDAKTIRLKWNDKEFQKDLADLVDLAPATQVAAAPPPAGSAVRGAGTPSTAEPDKTNPYQSSRACDPGDNTPAGTIKDGMKVVRSVTPFGSGCRWVPVPK